jgi:hypothetical protein
VEDLTLIIVVGVNDLHDLAAWIAGNIEGSSVGLTGICQRIRAPFSHKEIPVDQAGYPSAKGVCYRGGRPELGILCEELAPFGQYVGSTGSGLRGENAQQFCNPLIIVYLLNRLSIP